MYSHWAVFRAVYSKLPAFVSRRRKVVSFPTGAGGDGGWESLLCECVCGLRLRYCSGSSPLQAGVLPCAIFGLFLCLFYLIVGRTVEEKFQEMKEGVSMTISL